MTGISTYYCSDDGNILNDELFECRMHGVDSFEVFDGVIVRTQH